MALHRIPVPNPCLLTLQQGCVQGIPSECSKRYYLALHCSWNQRLCSFTVVLPVPQAQGMLCSSPIKWIKSLWQCSTNDMVWFELMALEERWWQHTRSQNTQKAFLPNLLSGANLGNEDSATSAEASQRGAFSGYLLIYLTSLFCPHLPSSRCICPESN